MSRSGRRYKPLQQSNGSGSLGGCDWVRLPRARVLVLCLVGVLVLAVVLGVYLSNDTAGGRVDDRMPAADLTKDRVRVRTGEDNERTHTHTRKQELEPKA